MMGSTLQKFITNSYFVNKYIISIALAISYTCLYMGKKLKISAGRQTPNSNHNGLFYLVSLWNERMEHWRTDQATTSDQPSQQTFG